MAARRRRDERCDQTSGPGWTASTFTAFTLSACSLQLAHRSATQHAGFSSQPLAQAACLPGSWRRSCSSAVPQAPASRPQVVEAPGRAGLRRQTFSHNLVRSSVPTPLPLCSIPRRSGLRNAKAAPGRRLVRAAASDAAAAPAKRPLPRASLRALWDQLGINVSAYDTRLVSAGLA